MGWRTMSLLRLLIAVSAALVSASPAALVGENVTPVAQVLPAPDLRLTGDVDSNSPAIWDRSEGVPRFFVMTSTAGRPSLAEGISVRRLEEATPVTIDPWPGGGVWMEAVLTDDAGTWYGYFHNEIVAEVCGDLTRVIPRIGAARSFDQGRTWEPLGTIVEAPPNSHECDTVNRYFVGGVGDLSVALDAESRDVYIYYSQYVRQEGSQGLGVARLAWADRDEPAGRAMIWNGRVWLPPQQVELQTDDGVPVLSWFFPAAEPIFPASEDWHEEVDAFWGPSVHYNTHLEQYVMLLNRATDPEWTQEGVYVSYSRDLRNPASWSHPVKLLDKGNWYPQVMGLEPGEGTDKRAGEVARLFMSGTSRHLIRFSN